MTYTRTSSDRFVVRDVDGANVPVDAITFDGENYRAWLAAGGIPGPYVPPPPPPVSLSPLAIINAFEAWGIASQVLASTDELTKAKFFASQQVSETEPLLIGALRAVGKTVGDLKAAIASKP